MKQYYIYKIICLCGEWNGKFYIGKHYGKLDDVYTGSGKLIREYFKEYGKEKDITYEKIIIEIGDEFNICDLEREYIREGMESELCLNLYCVSSRGNFGTQHSEESRKKMRKPKSEEAKQKLRKPKSKEHRRKISEGMKGRTFSEESRKKMSEAKKGRVPWNKGKHLSDETKQKLSEATKRRYNEQ